MFVRGETLSAHSARPRKIPGWIVVVRWKYLCKQAALWKTNNRNCIMRVFVCFLFQILHWLTRLSFENNSTWFLSWRAEENLVVITSIFALEASLLGQIFVLRTSNFRGATIISADSSSTETLYCLIRNKGDFCLIGWLFCLYPGFFTRAREIINKMAAKDVLFDYLL